MLLLLLLLQTALKLVTYYKYTYSKETNNWNAGRLCN